jgi:uncharacterized protein
MVTLLERLGHSRVLARISPRPAASEPASTPGYVHEQATWALRPREQGRAARSFTDSIQHDRPRLLGGALDRLVLPDVDRLGSALAQIGACEGRSPVFLDGETTGLGDCVAFVLGIAHLAPEGLIVEQWTLERLGGEPAMLAHALARLAELGPSPLISFNGASFDVPLLRRRAERCGLPAEVLAGEHFDLLHAARRIWADRADDCRLGTLEREQLGVQRREDLPSHAIPQVFEDWLREPGDPVAARRLRAVVLHNQADLVTLPALVVRLAERVEAPSDLAMAVNAAGLLIKHGRLDRARAMLERWVDAGPRGREGASWREAVVCLAELERRAGARERAAACWRRVIELDPGDPEACEALAKHHEHHAGEHDRALALARRSRTPDPLRIARLERKLGLGIAAVIEPEAEPVIEPEAEPTPTRPEANPVREPERSSMPFAMSETRIDPAWRSSVALRFAPWRRPSRTPVPPEPSSPEPSSRPPAPEPSSRSLLVEREDRPTYRLFTR